MPIVARFFLSELANTTIVPISPTLSQAANRTRIAPSFGRAIASVREVVVMVSIVGALLFPGVTDVGLKVQLVPVGNPEQVKFVTGKE